MHLYGLWKADLWRRPLLCRLWVVSADTWVVAGRSAVFCVLSLSLIAERWWPSWLLPVLGLLFLCPAKLLCVWLQEFRLDCSPFWMEWRQRFHSRVSVSHSRAFTETQPEVYFSGPFNDAVKCLWLNSFVYKASREVSVSFINTCPTWPFTVLGFRDFQSWDAITIHTAYVIFSFNITFEYNEFCYNTTSRVQCWEWVLVTGPDIYKPLSFIYAC